MPQRGHGREASTAFIDRINVGHGTRQDSAPGVDSTRKDVPYWINFFEFEYRWLMRARRGNYTHFGLLIFAAFSSTHTPESMSSTETRNKRQEEKKTRFPRLLSYVTIKLDPVKSVEILDDDEATVAAHDTVSKVYIGYIATVSIFISIQRQKMTYPLLVWRRRMVEQGGQRKHPLPDPSPTVWSSQVISGRVYRGRHVHTRLPKHRPSISQAPHA